MKKLVLSISLMVLFLSLQSCDGPCLSCPSAPECDYKAYGNVSFSNLNLKHPDGMSNFYNSSFGNQPIKNLHDILQTIGDGNYIKSAAKIHIKLTSDGTNCRGEKPFTYEPLNEQSMYPKEVKGTSVDIKTPTSGAFSGDIVATINTSEFINNNAKIGETYGQWYRVVWSTSSLKTFGVSFPLNGDLMGKKITLVQRTGRKSDNVKPSLLLEDGGIIIGGIKKQI